MSETVKRLLEFVREYYASNDVIPLHAPVFRGNEQAYVAETITSSFVSSVGQYVNRFEQDVAAFTSSPAAIATVNGTAALHVCLELAGVSRGDLVITQPLTFVATCNAIRYCGADPLFIDIDATTLGLSPNAMEAWLAEFATHDGTGQCVLKDGQRRISACLPMHTFGHPADMQGLTRVCEKWNLALVEDAAESLGSTYYGRHTGTLGRLGALSFNGNKIITTGGGGMILCDEETGCRAKHLTTTAKKPHPYEYIHDEVGFNYRLPNLNAALGVAQMEQLPAFINEKRALAACYLDLLEGSDLEFVSEPAGCRSNYWLNAIICQSRQQRDQILEITNSEGVTTRPVWTLMNSLELYARCICGPLKNAEWLAERLLNLPSGIVSNKH
jgi:aminotransferase in exopolysaccharide biosynthesis